MRKYKSNILIKEILYCLVLIFFISPKLYPMTFTIEPYAGGEIRFFDPISEKNSFEVTSSNGSKYNVNTPFDISYNVQELYLYNIGAKLGISSYEYTINFATNKGIVSESDKESPLKQISNKLGINKKVSYLIGLIADFAGLEFDFKYSYFNFGTMSFVDNTNTSSPTYGQTYGPYNFSTEFIQAGMRYVFNDSWSYAKPFIGFKYAQYSYLQFRYRFHPDTYINSGIDWDYSLSTNPQEYYMIGGGLFSNEEKFDEVINWYMNASFYVGLWHSNVTWINAPTGNDVGDQSLNGFAFNIDLGLGPVGKIKLIGDYLSLSYSVIYNMSFFLKTALNENVHLASNELFHDLKGKIALTLTF